MKRTFRSQLDFSSVIKLSATLGFGSGIFLAIVMLLNAVMQGKLTEGIALLLLVPFFSAIGNAFTGLIAYPVYAWYCDYIKGQHIAGKFAEVSQESTPGSDEQS